MAGDVCSYDCANPPSRFEKDADISGIGMIIGYVGSAGFVVLVLLWHYLFVFDPSHDNLRNDRDGSIDSEPSFFRPNPIDALLLRNFRRFWRKFTALGYKFAFIWPARAGKNATSDISIASAQTIRLPDKQIATIGAQSRRQKILEKCILAMSDLQLLTGFSVLVSGYAQLNCRISCYHWQIMVYLGWFSSITHLACLTFLRRYLYRHPGERVWRLVSMALIIVIFVIAMVPTKQYTGWVRSYDRTQSRSLNSTVSSPNDFAVCHFKRSFRAQNFYSATEFDVNMSIALLIVAFFFRIAFLHKCFSRSILSRLRESVGIIIRARLKNQWVQHEVQSRPDTAYRHLFYHPLLACFLAAEVTLDLVSSMFLEIWWLIVSYSFGVIRLIDVWEPFDGGFHRWSFGQVIAVVALAAPLLTVIGSKFFDEDDSNPTSKSLSCQEEYASEQTLTSAAETRISVVNLASPPSRTQTLKIAANDSNMCSDGVNDHPDYILIHENSSYKIVAVFAVILVVCISSSMLDRITDEASGIQATVFRLLVPDFLSVNVLVWFPLIIGVSLPHIILWNFSIERHLNTNTTLKIVARVAISTFFLVGFFCVCFFVDSFWITGGMLYGMALLRCALVCFLLLKSHVNERFSSKRRSKS